MPGALPTVVIRPPTIKGKVKSYDASAALKMPGVVAVTELPSGVAVTAKTFDQALKAKSAVQVTWGSGTVDGVSDADIEARLAAAIPPMTPAPPLTQRVDATFEFAFVNHAPMEVGSAVADVQVRVRRGLGGDQVADRSSVGSRGCRRAQRRRRDPACGPGRRLLRPADLPRAGSRGSARVEGDQAAREADVDPQR